VPLPPSHSTSRFLTLPPSLDLRDANYSSTSFVPLDSIAVYESINADGDRCLCGLITRSGRYFPVYIYEACAQTL
jgi:hypothetical protein